MWRNWRSLAQVLPSQIPCLFVHMYVPESRRAAVWCRHCYGLEGEANKPGSAQPCRTAVCVCCTSPDETPTRVHIHEALIPHTMFCERFWAQHVAMRINVYHVAYHVKSTA